ncbi:MAG: hypothetical protein Q9208_006112 [Pyrenodesmia sp. 3 TL-2023]
MMKSANLKQEAQDARIDLSDDDPETLERLLTYLYTADYGYQEPTEEHKGEQDVAEATNSGSSSTKTQDAAANTASSRIQPEQSSCEVTSVRLQELLNNAHVYALAEKYDIQTLKTLAKDNFAACSMGKWDDESLYTVLEAVYEITPTTDRGLRDVISEICARQLDEPYGWSTSRLMFQPKFQSIIYKDASIALDLLNLAYEEKLLLRGEVLALETSLDGRDKEVQNLRDRNKNATVSAQAAARRAGEEQKILRALVLKDTNFARVPILQEDPGDIWLRS